MHGLSGGYIWSRVNGCGGAGRSVCRQASDFGDRVPDWRLLIPPEVAACIALHTFTGLAGFPLVAC